MFHSQVILGLLDLFTARPVYFPGSGYSVTRPGSSGSRYGQPSILASTGQLSHDTEEASLSIRPVSAPGFITTRPRPSGSRFGQPSILATTGKLTPDTQSASLSIKPVQPSSGSSTVIAVSPWVTVPSGSDGFLGKSLPTSESETSNEGSR